MAATEVGDTLRELKAANRALTALGRVSAVAFSATDERRLYQDVCDILVSEAGYRLAWVGLPEHGADHRVLPVASQGDRGGYFVRTVIRWDDSPEGSGPIGEAIRRGEIQFINDDACALHFALWHDEALKQGLPSCIAIPLKHDDEVFAALVVYSASPDAFKATELSLLAQLGLKLSFAVGALRFRSLVETSPDWVWETDAEARYTYCNPRVQEAIGYTPQQVVGNTPFEFMLPDEANRAKEITGPLVAARQPFYCLTTTHRHKDGREVIIETSGVPRLDLNGGFLGYHGISRNVTERHHAERLLREKERRYRTLVDTMAEGIMVLDATGIIVTCNPGAARILSLPADQLLGKHLRDAAFPRIDDSGHELAPEDYPFRRALRSREPLIAIPMGLIRPDHSQVWIEVSAYPLFPDGGGEPSGVLISFTDITERRNHLDTLRRNYEELDQAHRKLQSVHAQMLHSEKMASIGRLAAGIAHEINNPVGYVNANLGTLESYIADINSLLDAYESATQKLPADRAERQAIENVRKAIHIDYLREDIAALLRESREGVTRVKQIVQDLKDFSRSDAGEWQWSDLNKGMESTLNIVWNELKYKAKVEKHYGELPEVECVPSQINQVFMNLLVNAGQALTGQGSIEIRSGTEGSEWVWVAVSDTGCGISPENLTRLFDPFFTTKPVGQGTGLGLSLSYGIVARHGGRIDVQSELGKGTTFTVWLPVQQSRPNVA